MRWLDRPLLHFLAGGAVLFALLHRPVAPAATAAPLVVSAADVERLRADYVRDTGLAPGADDERALIARAVDEELLYREALARGLDAHDRSIATWLVQQMRVLDDDPEAGPDALLARARALGLDRTDHVVRRILVQKMRLLAARLGERAPAEADLARYFDAHRDDYRLPARITFRHVFFAAPAGARAAEAARVLVAGAPPADDAGRAGDPFPVPAHVVGQTAARLEPLFGVEFVRRVMDAPVGAWTGPLPSAYGVHLVWVESREPARDATLAEVRSRLAERWRDEDRARRVAAFLDDLRARHPVRVESAAWRQARAS
jgi:hypothetical protein